MQLQRQWIHTCTTSAEIRDIMDLLSDAADTVIPYMNKYNVDVTAPAEPAYWNVANGSYPGSDVWLARMRRVCTIPI